MGGDINNFEGPVDGDWWVVKASAGNGGKDIWVMARHNFNTVLAELPKGYICRRSM